MFEFGLRLIPEQSLTWDQMTDFLITGGTYCSIVNNDKIMFCFQLNGGEPNDLIYHSNQWVTKLGKHHDEHQLRRSKRERKVTDGFGSGLAVLLAKGALVMYDVDCSNVTSVSQIATIVSEFSS